MYVVDFSSPSDFLRHSLISYMLPFCFTRSNSTHVQPAVHSLLMDIVVALSFDKPLSSVNPVTYMYVFIYDTGVIYHPAKRHTPINPIFMHFIKCYMTKSVYELQPGDNCIN